MLYSQMFVLRRLTIYSVLLAGLGFGNLVALGTERAWAQSNTKPATTTARTKASRAEAALRRSANSGTVTVITGGVEGVSNTYQELASDLASVLDVRSELRVLPIIGYGSLQNIEDLLYLNGIDFGMVHSDVMRHIQQRQLPGGAKRKLRFVTKLYDESIHILAGKKITDIKQLSGQTVIVGRPGSGNEMSALTLIGDLQLKVKTVHFAFAEGVEKVRKGEAAAMFVVTRKPAAKLRKIPAKSGLHFLSVPMNETVLETYEPDPLTSADYPGLVPGGSEIVTARMSAVLAVYNWQVGSSRYENVTRFIKSFGSKLEKLKQASRKDVWEKLDLTGEVKGWERYGPAANLVKEILTARAAKTAKTDAVRDPEFVLFADYIRQKAERNLSEEQIRRLYERFKIWGQTQANNAPQQ